MTDNEQIQALGALAAAIGAESLAGTDHARVATQATASERSPEELIRAMAPTLHASAADLEAQFKTARRVRERLEALCQQIGAL